MPPVPGQKGGVLDRYNLPGQAIPAWYRTPANLLYSSFPRSTCSQEVRSDISALLCAACCCTIEIAVHRTPHRTLYCRLHSAHQTRLYSSRGCPRPLRSPHVSRYDDVVRTVTVEKGANPPLTIAGQWYMPQSLHPRSFWRLARSRVFPHRRADRIQLARTCVVRVPSCYPSVVSKPGQGGRRCAPQVYTGCGSRLVNWGSPAQGRSYAGSLRRHPTPESSPV